MTRDRDDEAPPLPFGSAAVLGSGAGWSDEVTATALEDAQTPTPFDTPESERYRDPLLLGAGAMGRVDAVHDTRLERTVAMKTIRSDLATADLKRRFVREAMLTARLDHPGIVSVYDAGQRADGAAFYTMRMVQGRSLAEVLRSTSDRIARERLLRDFHSVCEAVAYAHTRGVIHRDLKPSNIMISDFGKVQVVDWGLARSVDHADAGLHQPTPEPTPTVDPALTEIGAVIGTPAYMSPEQARGEPASKATDVWALGAVLFELLDGRRWTDVRRSDGATESPELMAVLTKALAEDPADRYDDAVGFANDLGHYLDGRRVEAHSYTTWQLLRRVARNWRAPLLVALIALIALVTLGVVAVEATVAERDRAVAAELRTRTAETAAHAAADLADRHLARSLSEHAVRHLSQGGTAQAAVLAGEALARDPSLASARGVWGAIPSEPPLTLDTRVELPADCRVGAVAPSGDLVACLHGPHVTVWSIAPLEERLRVPLADAKAAAFHEGAGAIAITAPTGRSAGGEQHLQVHVRALDGGLTSPLPWGVALLNFIPNDRWLLSWTTEDAYWTEVGRTARTHRGQCQGNARLTLALAGRTQSKALLICQRSNAQQVDLTDGAQVALPEADAEVTPTAGWWMPDGRVLLGDVFGGLAWWDPQSGEVGERTVIARGMIQTIEATDDGALALIHSDGSPPIVWDVAQAQVRLSVPAAYGDTISLSRDGRWLVAADRAHTLRRFRLRGSAPQRFASAKGLTDVRLSADGRTLVATGESLTTWATDDGTARRRQAPSLLKAGAFSVDGDHFYGVVLQPGVQVWRTDSWEPGPVLGAPTNGYRRVEGLADSWLVASGMSHGLDLIHDVDGERDGHVRLEPTRIFTDLSATPDGRFTVALSSQGDLMRLEIPRDGPPFATPVSTHPTARAVAMGPMGRIAVAERGRLVVIDGATRQEVAVARTSGRKVLDVAYSPDGTLIATAERDGAATLWSATTGALIASMRGHDKRAPALTFDRTGEWLVTASWDRSVRRWHVPSMMASPDVVRTRTASRRAALDLTLEDLFVER